MWKLVGGRFLSVWELRGLMCIGLEKRMRGDRVWGILIIWRRILICWKGVIGRLVPFRLRGLMIIFLFWIKLMEFIGSNLITLINSKRNIYQMSSFSKRKILLVLMQNKLIMVKLSSVSFMKIITKNINIIYMRYFSMTKKTKNLNKWMVFLFW